MSILRAPESFRALLRRIQEVEKATLLVKYLVAFSVLREMSFHVGKYIVGRTLCNFSVLAPNNMWRACS